MRQWGALFGGCGPGREHRTFDMETSSSMSVETTRSVQVDEWQKNYCVVTSSICTPKQKADAYRALLLHIQYAYANSEISQVFATNLFKRYTEKMVRALFAVARCQQPAVIFIDEIDSLLSQRGDGEHESSRRIKTEFLVQLDGATTSSEDRILVVGATNRPQEIDEAARRRLVKRLYIPLPEASARKQIVGNLMSKEQCCLSDEETDLVVQQSDGFSGADMTQLCREASLGPIRSLHAADIATISPDQVRPIAYIDFENAFKTVRPTVSPKDLELYENWNETFGCGK